MDYKNLILELTNSILCITINRENKLNALNKETLNELHTAFSYAGAESAVRGVIITGKGNRAFVAGADIAEFSSFGKEAGAALAHEGHTKVFNLIANSSKPVIAAINGFALGGGLELAMACHIRTASDTAKMGLPEVGLGLIPGYGGTQRLTQLVGKGRALEMILSAAMISAADAYRIGLVNQVFPEFELMEQSKKLMQTITGKSQSAIASAIKAVNASVNGVNGYETEIEEFSNCFGTADFKEGVSAFLEKRKPEFN